MYPQHIIDRFWSRVDRSDANGCWPWTHARNWRNYGTFRYLKRHIAAHRMSWALTNGRDIPDGGCILHRCDNPPCVRPDHLWLGTKKDNTQDMVAKGRAKGKVMYGTDNPHSVLTPELVREIRRQKAEGIGLYYIARALGIGTGSVAGVIYGKTWTHVV